MFVIIDLVEYVKPANHGRSLDSVHGGEAKQRMILFMGGGAK